MAVKSHSCPSWRFQRLSLVCLPSFLDSGNVDIVAVEEVQEFSVFQLTVPARDTLSDTAFTRYILYTYLIIAWEPKLIYQDLAFQSSRDGFHHISYNCGRGYDLGTVTGL